MSPRPLPALVVALSAALSRAVVVALFAVLSVGPTLAFEESRAKATVEVIASDEFGGRFSGLPSGGRVEDYVAARFAEWDLLPAGDDGSYFHEFPMLVTRERSASLSLLDGDFGRVDFLYGEEFTLVTNSGSGNVTAEAVLVGRGLYSPEREWDDYAAAGDVIGKVVVVVRGTPENGYNWARAGSRDSTLHEAARRGAAGVLFYGGTRTVQGAAVHDGSYFPEVPSAVIGDRVMHQLLLDTGWSLDRYEKALAKAPTALATGKRLRFRARVAREADGRARNVAGLLRGADPHLSDEIIVVGGHMDHVGVNGAGRIYNGANDNASGTAVVMELARSLAAGPRVARTVVFMTFAGEEQGLLGSEAFVEDPPWDLGRVVAMINLDMVGHGSGKFDLGGSEYYPQIRAAFKRSLAAVGDSVLIGRSWRGEVSDHAPFFRLGIPAMNARSDGDHKFYHRQEDDPQWIDAKVLGSVGRGTEAWLRLLADWPEPLLAPHREGRTLLYASEQVDFDGRTKADAPDWVRAVVRWAEPKKPAALTDSLVGLRSRHALPRTAVVRNLAGIREASKDGTRAALFGVRASAAAREPERAALAALDAGFVMLDAAKSAPDSALLAEFHADGMIFLASPGAAGFAELPAAAKRCVRVFPGRGERIADPGAIPRKNTLFVVSLERGATAEAAAETIRELTWDRVHLDLVPWLGAAGEPALFAFLEELKHAGPFTTQEIVALLGGNLARL